MKMESIFRFKNAFQDCESYEEVHERLGEIGDHFKTLQSMGVKKIDKGEDDYHHLAIYTKDPNIIKELKLMGFDVPLDEDIK